MSKRISDGIETSPVAGTWTAVIADAESGGNEGVIGGSAVPKFLKIGPLVILTMNLANLNTAGMTAGNDLWITGIPFLAEGTTSDTYFGLVNPGQITFDTTLIVRLTGARIAFRIYTASSGSTDIPLKVSDIVGTSSDLEIQVIYNTAL